ncbi:MAG: hypothetical protein R3D25_23015 [Geminicoccaceae bacterium]
MASFLQILPEGGGRQRSERLHEAGWITAAAAGVLVVEQKARQRPELRPRHFAIACLVSIVVGLIALKRFNPPVPPTPLTNV